MADPRRQADDSLSLSLLSLRLLRGGSMHNTRKGHSSGSFRVSPRSTGDFACLPDELLLEIFKFLSAKEVCGVMTVCKEWWRLANDKAIWKALCKRTWQNSYWNPHSRAYVALDESLNNDWQQVYRQRLLVDSRWSRGDCRVFTLGHHRAQIDGVFFDDRRIISVSEDHCMKVWDAYSGDCVAAYDGFPDMVVSLAVDGDKALVGLWDHSLRIVEIATGNCLGTLTGHAAGVRCVKWDANFIVSGSFDNTIRVWDRHTGECLRRLCGHREGVAAVQFDAMSDTLISGSLDGTVRVWCLSSGECTGVLSAGDAIWCLQYDNNKIVAGSSNGVVHVWDRVTGDPVGVLRGHRGAVTSLQFIRDRLVTGSEDCSIRVWNLNSGTEIAVLSGHTGAVWSLQCDDTKIISGSSDGDRSLKLWDFAYNLGADPRASAVLSSSRLICEENAAASSRTASRPPSRVTMSPRLPPSRGSEGSDILEAPMEEDDPFAEFFSDDD